MMQKIIISLQHLFNLLILLIMGFLEILLLPASLQFTLSLNLLPLEGGLARKISKRQELENKATVLYIGMIPHGFNEHEMEGLPYIAYII